MSNPDQPDTPPLTRRRLREIRSTGATPVITPEVAEEAAAAAENTATAAGGTASVPDTVESAPEPAPEPTPAPLPRAAEPAVIPPAPIADARVDLGASPLTRRQAREQERIRTASVPVVSPDISAPSPAVTPVAQGQPERTTPSEARWDADDPQENAGSVDAAAASDDPAPGVDPSFGSELLAGQAGTASIPPSFDQLIARSASATGSIATPNALILSQTPSAAPLGAPVTATGEVLITGTFALPEGLGSVGHAVGAADGKDLDAALIDGELPPASSPTPIAASAAISTVRNSGEEIIRPPAPEKGSRLMLALVITAGALALALAGVLILAVTTGVFG